MKLILQMQEDEMKPKQQKNTELNRKINKLLNKNKSRFFKMNKHQFQSNERCSKIVFRVMQHTTLTEFYQFLLLI